MPEDVNKNLERIYQKLRDYLLRDANFLKPGLNRVYLASLLRINEKYICKAIRVFEGKSLGEYIESLRIEYACCMLILHPDYTISAVALECGLGSRSTFFRIFRKHYGCSPDNFRKKGIEFHKIVGEPINEELFSLK